MESSVSDKDARLKSVRAMSIRADGYCSGASAHQIVDLTGAVSNPFQACDINFIAGACDPELPFMCRAANGNSEPCKTFAAVLSMAPKDEQQIFAGVRNLRPIDQDRTAIETK